MRRANNGEFINNEGQIIGINLGYDFTSEHEWGISPLRGEFGIETELLGFEGKKNTLVPKELDLVIGNTSILIYSSHNKLEKGKKLQEQLQWLELELHKDYRTKELRDMATSWGEGDFGVHVKKEHTSVLENLYEAFQTKNGIITLSAPGLLGGTGLMLIDYRQIPEETLVEAREVDKVARDLYSRCKEYEAGSGIHELLEEKGKEYIFLGVKSFDKEDN
ncbi:hypothetical protein GOV10_06175, partial [Candidatus Woesearchaeota archaeon]|nr:hypothetical protein [Candidatus Woesearchaeota archaeon]